MKPRAEESDGVRDDENLAGAVVRRIGNKALAGKLMEGPGLNTGIEQHERIADHIVAAGPMPYHRFCRV